MFSGLTYTLIIYRVYRGCLYICILLIGDAYISYIICIHILLICLYKHSMIALSTSVPQVPSSAAGQQQQQKVR